MSAFHHLPVLTSRSPAAAYRQAEAILKAERQSRELWADFEDNERALALELIRDNLIRLLLDPSWIVGSLGCHMGGQLAVTFMIDLDSDSVHSARERMMFLDESREEQLREGLRKDLLALKDKLAGPPHIE